MNVATFLSAEEIKNELVKMGFEAEFLTEDFIIDDTLEYFYTYWLTSNKCKSEVDLWQKISDSVSSHID